MAICPAEALGVFSVRPIISVPRTTASAYRRETNVFTSRVCPSGHVSQPSSGALGLVRESGGYVSTLAGAGRVSSV